MAISCGVKCMTLNTGNTPKRRGRTRANGTGTAFKRGRTWTARVVVGWKVSADGTHKVPEWRVKGGFATKKDAINFCTTLLSAGPRAADRPSRYTLRQLYDEWETAYSPRIIPSTMGCYSAAFKHFATLHDTYVDLISARDLQECLDACVAGRRTHQNMKVVAGLLWKYAMDAQIVERNVASNLYIGRHESKQRDPLTEQEIAVIRDAIGRERYAEYIYCLCYLGFRPGEFLSLRKDHYHVMEGVEVLINGSKTEAGKNRIVVIPPQIIDIVRSRLWVPGTPLLFPQYCFRRNKGTLTGFKQMTDDYLRKAVFQPMMARLGIAEGKVPYSARHSYSDKLKRATGDEKAKAGLMGHTYYAFTQSHYQSTDLDDLLDIATSME